MPGPTREWATFTDPADPDTPLVVDVTFLTSHWECIFGRGCQGVLTEPAPELGEGCCSYGAHFTDPADRRRTEREARRLRDDEWQFAAEGRRHGVVARVGNDERTRVFKGACIFLNRPGFARGPGCAFHLAAERRGVHFSELKPEICWQLPLRRVPATDDDGHEVTRLTEFGREGWGEGGEEFAWWCTEAPEAFRGRRPVYRSQERELRAMLGDGLYAEVARYLDARLGARERVRHPSEVPVRLSGTRRRRDG